MSTTTRTTITKRDAERVLAAVKRQCRAYIGAGYAEPVLIENWDWLQSGPSAAWSIVWEEGPYDWAINFPFGGIDQEFGFRIADVSERIPGHVYAEAITSWAVAICLI